MAKKRRIKIRRKAKRAPRRIKVVRLPKPKVGALEPRRKIKVKGRGASRETKALARKLGKRLGKIVGRRFREPSEAELEDIEEAIAEQKTEIKTNAKRPQEWMVSFVYTATNRSVDFIAVAYTGSEAIKYVRRELRKTEAGARMLKNFSPSALPFEPPHYRHESEVGEVIER